MVCYSDLIDEGNNLLWWVRRHNSLRPILLFWLMGLDWAIVTVVGKIQLVDLSGMCPPYCTGSPLSVRQFFLFEICMLLKDSCVLLPCKNIVKWWLKVTTSTTYLTTFFAVNNYWVTSTSVSIFFCKKMIWIFKGLYLVVTYHIFKRRRILFTKHRLGVWCKSIC